MTGSSAFQELRCHAAGEIPRVAETAGGPVSLRQPSCELSKSCPPDPDRGPYREIVEAAESCQVSIIHPGKRRNPDEPNLEDLIARADPFN